MICYCKCCLASTITCRTRADLLRYRTDLLSPRSNLVSPPKINIGSLPEQLSMFYEEFNLTEFEIIQDSGGQFVKTSIAILSGWINCDKTLFIELVLTDTA
jgi:hypothetical protein